MVFFLKISSEYLLSIQVTLLKFLDNGIVTIPTPQPISNKFEPSLDLAFLLNHRQYLQPSFLDKYTFLIQVFHYN